MISALSPKPKQSKLCHLILLAVLFSGITTAQTKISSTKQIKVAQKVLLGNWVGSVGTKKLSIKVDKIEGDKITGHILFEGKKHLLNGTYTTDSSDQPCSKAFMVNFSETSPDASTRSLTIHFVGYEALRESDFGLECAGNLNGSEASGYWKGADRLATQHFTLTKKD